MAKDKPQEVEYSTFTASRLAEAAARLREMKIALEREKAGYWAWALEDILPLAEMALRAELAKPQRPATEAGKPEGE